MDRIRYSVMTRLAPYPSLAGPLARLRGEGELVDSRTDAFYEPLVPHRGDLVVGTFEVVGGELGAITRRLNARFTRTEDAP